jgi:transcriptional regulator with XRE-family HTH domain
MPDQEEVTAAVARNTRRLRTARGWSLDQLASRSDLSKGMLVHLEQGRTNPSLSTLCKLAETFGLTVASLVELHEAPVVRVVRPAETVELWRSDQGGSGRLLVGSDEREHVELWRWSFAPGDGSQSDAHVDGTRELLHVVSGTLTLEVGGVEHSVSEGGAALVHADRPHAYRNEGRRRLELVMVVLQPDADLDQWTAERAGGAAHGEGSGSGH